MALCHKTAPQGEKACYTGRYVRIFCGWAVAFVNTNSLDQAYVNLIKSQMYEALKMLGIKGSSYPLTAARALWIEYAVTVPADQANDGLIARYDEEVIDNGKNYSRIMDTIFGSKSRIDSNSLVVSALKDLEDLRTAQGRELYQRQVALDKKILANKQGKPWEETKGDVDMDPSG